MESKYLILLVLIIIVVIVSVILITSSFQGEQDTVISEEEQDTQQEEPDTTEEEQEEEGPYSSTDNKGMKLNAYQDLIMDPYGTSASNTYVYSSEMDVAAGQEWDKNTDLKFCVAYKSTTASSTYRSAILNAISSIDDDYEFQIDLFEYATDQYCGSWNKYGGGKVYQISIALNKDSSNVDTFHEVCIEDLNSLIDTCALEWGINTDIVHITNIYRTWISSPSTSVDDYTIYDYYKVYVDGVQVSDSVFPNQEFDTFSGTIDDEDTDDFNGWDVYYSAYAVST